MSSKVLSNLDSVGEVIGSLLGIADGIEEQKYIEGLIREAHGKATNAFDLAAAATGAAGHLSHMYEFGTTGITPGQPKFPDPTSEAARLWTHRLVGRGGNQDIAFTFRPALNRNPIPTTANTGVSSKYLRRISKRKYIFWNRALVTETGQTVDIKSKKGNYLFVPFYGMPSRNPLNKRGFMMWDSKRLGPMKSTPGQRTKGTFTAFWIRWWGSQGEQIMAADMMKNVTRDVEIAEAEMAKKANALKMKPPAANNPASVAQRARFATKKSFGREIR